MSEPCLTTTIKRLQWKSRRGLLELDVLLGAFWQRYAEQLSAAEADVLQTWLELSDDELWALLKTPPAHGRALALKIVSARHYNADCQVPNLTKGSAL